ncbi:MAG: hypothetical protein H9533_04870 [Rhodobacteraceae bacterium]|nr:hypothetical protein [Paracoccaceae bacterium]
MTSTQEAAKLEELFGSFRAEWLREDIYRLFNEPQYFSYLAAPKSCVLVGGRGSGKTTALKCMSYEGQHALGKFNNARPEFIGFYFKLNTNTVRSFSGSDQSIEEWNRLFGHFFNLMVCEEILNYLLWYETTFDAAMQKAPLNLGRMATSLGLKSCDSLEVLAAEIDSARLDLELYINNFSRARPTISPMQTPITVFLDELRLVKGHAATVYYIILDEYENLLDHQQRSINTLIKHSGENYFFKVGVRELGWRARSTLNPQETLISPADYERIHIEEQLQESFPQFASEVCAARLRAADLEQYGPPIDVKILLPGLTTKQESQRLGVAARVSEFRAQLTSSAMDVRIALLDDHEIFVFLMLANGDYQAARLSLHSFAQREKEQVLRYENYSYAALFAIGGKGRALNKYFCGHDVLAKITHRNIRFYMQLLNACIREQILSERSIVEPIDPELQTKAARDVALTYLRELEGVSSHGALLTKLVLGLGRIFQVMAANPFGARPECNQFEVEDLPRGGGREHESETDQLLIEAVMHMALVRRPGTKLSAEWDTRSWEYSLHPIFAPFFSYSHRQKRKMSITEAELISLTRRPKETIKQLLGNRSALADDKLPPQMSMFDEYFR